MRIGWIGLGGIGKPMAANVVRAGHEVIVCDLRAEPVAELVAEGAVAGTTPADVAAQTELVYASLPGIEASEQVAFGPDGLVEGARAGSLYVELSTLTPEVVQGIGGRLAARGIRFVDAPVSGGGSRREQGRLTVMAGGAAADFAEAKPVFDIIGEHVFHLGEVGTGNVAKLANNLIGLASALVSIEGLLLGVKGGIHPEALREVIMASSGGSKAFHRMVDMVLARGWEPAEGDIATAALRIVAKDLELATSFGAQIGVATAAADGARDTFVRAKDAGFGELEYWAVSEFLQQEAGVEVRAEGAGEA